MIKPDLHHLEIFRQTTQKISDECIRSEIAGESAEKRDGLRQAITFISQVLDQAVVQQVILEALTNRKKLEN